ncbi:hypothetical protein BXZ70DRAFT_903084 [Cristinia sonorae]|uniref:Helitron helicase-like domain-containing protein n=1 Tax=Cristinia sonorae TaxID=1940300 RepID=A0A8K0UEL3_9AGAR|nr:hypothetical protein BXZ70DRAFT_903084 [Cristinia sonorae]
MVELFLKHVLGVGQQQLGLYGKTSGYYGTVEQQGRLTLHLHMLVWIRNSLTPQEIRNNILDPSSDFQTKMVQYLESVHQGEFMNGTEPEIEASIPEYGTSPGGSGPVPPTRVLPETVPRRCTKTKCANCAVCQQADTWWERFRVTVDQLLWLSNRHSCRRVMTDSTGKKKLGLMGR